MFKRVALVLLSLLVLFALLVFGNDRYSHYKSWRELSPATISNASQWYITNRASNIGAITAICVYALDCSADRARLAIVHDLDKYDFEELRQLIWDRRFSSTCQGRTANLGLHLMRSQDNGEYDYSDHAFWSFSNNRFVPQDGSWSGGSFSEEPWERCSMDGAVFEVQNGVASKITN